MAWLRFERIGIASSTQPRTTPLYSRGSIFNRICTHVSKIRSFGFIPCFYFDPLSTRRHRIRRLYDTPRNPFKMFLYSLAANSMTIPLFYTCLHAYLILCCDTFVSFLTLGDTSSFGSFTNLRVINRIHSTVYYYSSYKKYLHVSFQWNILFIVSFYRRQGMWHNMFFSCHINFQSYFTVLLIKVCCAR